MPGDAAHSYPVTLEIEPPERFERAHVLLRVLICVALGMLHQSMVGLFFALYLLLPIAAAILISQRSAQRFLTQDAPAVLTLLDWVVGLYAYLLFASDQFPLDASTRKVRLRVQLQGSPNVGSALLRLVRSIPHVLVLALLCFVSGFVSFIAAIAILLNRRYPEGLYTFQCDVVAWLARLLAYHGSLVDAYPPFALTLHYNAPPPATQS